MLRLQMDDAAQQRSPATRLCAGNTGLTVSLWPCEELNMLGGVFGMSVTAEMFQTAAGGVLE